MQHPAKLSNILGLLYIYLLGQLFILFLANFIHFWKHFVNLIRFNFQFGCNYILLFQFFRGNPYLYEIHLNSLVSWKWVLLEYNFSSPKFFIGHECECLVLRSRQKPVWKTPTQLVHRDDPKLCSKSVRRCEQCQIAFNTTDILFAKTVGVSGLTDKTGSKKTFSGIVYTYPCTI